MCSKERVRDPYILAPGTPLPSTSTPNKKKSFESPKRGISGLISGSLTRVPAGTSGLDTSIGTLTGMPRKWKRQVPSPSSSSSRVCSDLLFARTQRCDLLPSCCALEA